MQHGIGRWPRPGPRSVGDGEPLARFRVLKVCVFLPVIARLVNLAVQQRLDPVGNSGRGSAQRFIDMDVSLGDSA